MTVTNQILTHDEIKSRLNSRNARYYSVGIWGQVNEENIWTEEG
jgi:hypothetical protein